MQSLLIDALRDVQVTVPQAVRRGDNAMLYCHYDMDGENLYSVKWYKGRREFYRYTPKENPAMKVFPVAGVIVKKLLVEMRRRVEEKVKGQSYEERAEAFVKVEDAILGIGRIQRVAELAGEVSVPDSTLEDPGKEVVPYTGVGSSDVSLLPVGTSQIHHRPAAPPTCYYCGKKEFLFECEQFQAVSVPIREKFVSANNLCRNCFCRKHRSESCPQPMRCLKCANQRPTPNVNKHHLLLHS
ncbi:conserved hypothetical protein [Culex quinquefasciatus]|uniref:Ig-like domain-containing protein n=1 Tax=Culex quinquefasciatus TaxID=7176 RepID=B0WFE5_CULQU|nr:conserved hypothetical protein [Culex quinquefasciatus]|eukprot:XP_001847429.1 conserved hypothetical protein [Culex quinquefasciatus]